MRSDSESGQHGGEGPDGSGGEPDETARHGGVRRVDRMATTRGLYFWLAYLAGALGVLILVSPASIAELFSVDPISRWWGLLGVGTAACLVVAARRLGRESLPEDWEAQKDEAREAEDWQTLYDLTDREAELHRRAGRAGPEVRARETLVDLAVDRLDHGAFQALSHLERLEELDAEAGNWAERSAELLRDIGSVERLADVLERLADRREDEAHREEEVELRAEIVECYLELDRPTRARPHLERLLEIGGDDADAVIDALEGQLRDIEEAKSSDDERDETTATVAAMCEAIDDYRDSTPRD